MKRFIYVFSKEDRDKLVGRGYNILKDKEDEDIYIFEAKEQMEDDLEGVLYWNTNILSF